MSARMSLMSDDSTTDALPLLSSATRFVPPSAPTDVPRPLLLRIHDSRSGAQTVSLANNQPIPSVQVDTRSVSRPNSSGLLGHRLAYDRLRELYEVEKARARKYADRLSRVNREMNNLLVACERMRVTVIAATEGVDAGRRAGAIPFPYLRDVDRSSAADIVAAVSQNLQESGKKLLDCVVDSELLLIDDDRSECESVMSPVLNLEPPELL
nr:ORF4 protein [Armillaria gallica negative stranded RNA virus 1]